MTEAARAAVVIEPLAGAADRWHAALGGFDVTTLASAGPDALRQALSAAAPSDGPLVVVGIGAAAYDAAIAASYDPRVAGVVLAFPVAGAGEVFEVWKEVPVLVLADARQRAALTPALATRWASSHPDSDVHVVSSIDVGDERFGSWDESFAEALDATGAWLRRVHDTVQRRVEVVCNTEDGWEIHGSLTMPSGDGHPVPATVLLHSGRSDRAVFSRLERLLARRGVATLSIDWRGRGRSQNRGTYFDLDADERTQGWRDARAAVDLLAAQPGVDATRVAMIGVVHGAEHAVAASIGDPRVLMLGVLTGYVPRNEEESAHLTSGAVDVFYISCAAHGPVTAAMRALVERTPPGRATMRVYPGAAIGYQLFDIDDQLEETLATWVADGLRAQVAS